MPLDQTATFNLNVEEIPFLNLRELDQVCKSWHINCTLPTHKILDFGQNTIKLTPLHVQALQ